MPTDFEIDRSLSLDLGVYRSPGLGNAWPELSEQLLALYRDRVQPLSWVPGDWFARVQAAMANGDVLRLLPPRMVNGTVKINDLPSWISSDPEHVDAWDQIATATNDAVAAYAQGQADIGRVKLAAAYANADFWDALYRADKAIVDAPSEIAGAVAGGVGRLFLANWWVFGLVGVGALVWFNKGSIARAAGKRIERGS